jgi:small multidrug resistance pump
MLNNFFLPIVMVAVLEAFAQSSVQLAHQTKAYYHILVAVVAYALVCVFLIEAYKYKGAGLVNVLWSGITMVLMIAIGHFVFNEHISTLEWLGISFIIVGIMIVNICCTKT